MLYAPCSLPLLCALSASALKTMADQPQADIRGEPHESLRITKRAAYFLLTRVQKPFLARTLTS